MINKEQLEKYIDSLDEEAIINYICANSRELKRNYNKMQKARSKQFSDGFMISRAKSTTNDANAQKAYSCYESSREYLVETIKIYNSKY